MKQFNLDEYLKNPSRKVVTRDGREVRIICTDFNFQGIQKIIGLVAKEKDEDLYIYHLNGRWAKSESKLDLFFAPTKREGWVNIYKDRNGAFTSNFIFETEKRAKEVIGEKHPTYLTTIKIEWEE